MKIIWQDIVIAIGFILYIGCGVVTKYIIVSVSLYTDAANEIESNPLARKTLDTRYGVFAMQATMIAFFTGVYWMLRRNYIKKLSETSYQIFAFYTLALTMLFLQNFLNDFPILLGILKV